jgi:hypothetical protein
MRGFLAVFERELTERRLLFVMALSLGVVAVALPLLPGFHQGGTTVAELRGGVALALAVVLSALTAVYLGGSVLASDLLERRLSFYFARPLSGWALWAGKVAAAAVLTFGGALLVLVPAVLFGGDLSPAGYLSLGVMDAGEAFLFWAASLVFLLFATNALSLMVRSRSPWITLDMVAVAVVGAVAWSARNRLVMEGVDPSRRPQGVDSLGWMEGAWILVPLAAVIAASAAQVLHGRTDLRRAHRAVSATLWSLLLALAIVTQGFTFWVVSAGPEDLVGITQVVAAPAGSVSSWIAIAGPAANRSGYNPGFLYDVASGRTLRTGFGAGSPWWGVPARISADGRRAVWLEYQETPFKSPVVLYQLDLQEPGARPVATSISYGFMPQSFALSPDGRRFAAVQDERLTVDDVETGRLLASIPLSGVLRNPRLGFVSPGRLRLYQAIEKAPLSGTTVFRPDLDFGIFELDLAAAKIEATGRLSGVLGLRGWTLSPDGNRMILRSGSRLQLRDARTGDLLASLGTGKEVSASFLPGNRIAVANPLPGKAGWELRVLAPDGETELRRFPFEGVQALIPVDSPTPGRLRIVTSGTGEPQSPWQVRVLDLESGAVKLDGTRDLAALVPPGDDGKSRISLEGKQGVVWTETATLRKRVILKDS